MVEMVFGNMKKNLRILMLAWRDMKHPKMGGAEIVTDIYLKGLTKSGNDVTLFTAKYFGAKDEEKFNGYEVIRNGGQGSVWWHGLKYAKEHEEEFDIIIDQVNTIPFFTPLAITNKKRRAFFHQLCRNIWFYESRFPVSLIGYVLEYFYLKLYRNTKTFVVSDSTKDDLVKYAWAKPRNILVLENQINFKPILKVSKKDDYFVFCGRLTQSKRVHDCIKALSNVKNSKLYLVGNGDDNYKRKLTKLVSKLGLDSRVVFTGKISNDERNKLMAKAIAILVTSVREGWGLIVTEANANGTVAITYDVEGLKDANKTGFITKRNTPEELGKLMNLLKNDKKLLIEKSLDSLRFAREHDDWDKNVEKLNGWLGVGR
jgi:glycosyltransferase involved in cell wall biosynthesis